MKKRNEKKSFKILLCCFNSLMNVTRKVYIILHKSIHNFVFMSLYFLFFKYKFSPICHFNINRRNLISTSIELRKAIYILASAYFYCLLALYYVCIYIFKRSKKSNSRGSEMTPIFRLNTFAATYFILFFLYSCFTNSLTSKQKKKKLKRDKNNDKYTFSQ